MIGLQLGAEFGGDNSSETWDSLLTTRRYNPDVRNLYSLTLFDTHLPPQVPFFHARLLNDEYLYPP
jgi:hypothetical protein